MFLLPLVIDDQQARESEALGVFLLAAVAVVLCACGWLLRRNVHAADLHADRERWLHRAAARQWGHGKFN